MKKLQEKEHRLPITKALLVASAWFSLLLRLPSFPPSLAKPEPLDRAERCLASPGLLLSGPTHLAADGEQGRGLAVLTC